MPNPTSTQAAPVASAPHVPNLPICAGCRHWSEMPGNPQNLKQPRQGLCKRFPPVPLMVPVQTPQGVIPQVMPSRSATLYDDTCGEHSPAATRSA